MISDIGHTVAGHIAHGDALCGGSGSELAPLALRSGADVYLSAEIKHSTAVWATDAGIAVIDGSHYATEKLATHALTQRLCQIAAPRF